MANKIISLKLERLIPQVKCTTDWVMADWMKCKLPDEFAIFVMKGLRKWIEKTKPVRPKHYKADRTIEDIALKIKLAGRRGDSSLVKVDDSPSVLQAMRSKGTGGWCRRCCCCRCPLRPSGALADVSVIERFLFI